MEVRRKRNEGHSDEFWPTYSRLFIVAERSVTEAMIRDAFEKFGKIEDVKVPRDHNTNEPRGIAYIKFSKTSEAAYALEAMHKAVLPGTSRPLKVMVASVRSEIQDLDDEEKYKRLFIHIPYGEDENNLADIFEEYGDVETVQVQRDRDTGKPKGFAYVKFRKFSHAAEAFERCNKKYRAIFAQPRAPTKRIETPFEHNINNLASSSAQQTSLISMMNTPSKGFTQLYYTCSPILTYMDIENLFDLVPGMEFCTHFVDLIGNFGKGTVKYSNPISAAYAVEKISKLEYPPGMKIMVKPSNFKFDPSQQTFNTIPNVVKNLQNAVNATTKTATPDLARLTEAVAEATKLIKKITSGTSHEGASDGPELNYCSVKLPPPKPLADIDSPVAKRCFLVCKPQPPPLTALRDVFCRFGDLINVYTLPNKTVGFARYASVDAANNAMKTLHGAEICGVRIKVVEAEEKPDDFDGAVQKRSRLEF